MCGHGYLSKQKIGKFLHYLYQGKKHANRRKIHRSEVVVQNHGNYPISTDGGIRVPRYPQARRILGLDHYLHSSYEKSMIERTMQYMKERTENFDDDFPSGIRNCKTESCTELVTVLCRLL